MKIDLQKFRNSLQQKIAYHTSKASAAGSDPDGPFLATIASTLMEVAMAIDDATIKESTTKIAILPKIEPGISFNLPCRLVRPVTEPIHNHDGSPIDNKRGNLWWATPLHSNFPSLLICTDGIPVLEEVQS